MKLKIYEFLFFLILLKQITEALEKDDKSIEVSKQTIKKSSHSRGHGRDYRIWTDWDEPQLSSFNEDVEQENLFEQNPPFDDSVYNPFKTEPIYSLESFNDYEPNHSDQDQEDSEDDIYVLGQAQFPPEIPISNNYEPQQSIPASISFSRPNPPVYSQELPAYKPETNNHKPTVFDEEYNAPYKPTDPFTTPKPTVRPKPAHAYKPHYIIRHPHVARPATNVFKSSVKPNYTYEITPRPPYQSKPVKLDHQNQSKPENSKPLKPENPNQFKPEYSKPPKPENPNQYKPEYSKPPKPENPNQSKPEYSKPLKPENPNRYKSEYSKQPKPENSQQYKPEHSNNPKDVSYKSTKKPNQSNNDWTEIEPQFDSSKLNKTQIFGNDLDFNDIGAIIASVVLKSKNQTFTTEKTIIS